MIDIILYSAFCIYMIYIVRTVKGMITFFAYIFFLLRDTPKNQSPVELRKTLMLIMQFLVKAC